MAFLSATGQRGTLAVWLLVSLPWIGSPPPSGAAQSAPTESAVKAELLARLPLFVTWPDASVPEESEPIIIGILGVDPLGDEIDRTTEGRQAAGHPYRVVRFPRLREMAGEPVPHILFVAESERDDYWRVLESMRRVPVLLVGEEPEFLRAGGHATVGIRGARPDVVIALDRLQDRGFRIDSRLLEVARFFDDLE